MALPTKSSKVDSLPKGSRVIVHGRAAVVHFWRFDRKVGAFLACVRFDATTEENPYPFANVASVDVKRAPKSAGPAPAYPLPMGAKGAAVYQ